MAIKQRQKPEIGAGRPLQVGSETPLPSKAKRKVCKASVACKFSAELFRSTELTTRDIATKWQTFQVSHKTKAPQHKAAGHFTEPD